LFQSLEQILGTNPTSFNPFFIRVKILRSFVMLAMFLRGLCKITAVRYTRVRGLAVVIRVGVRLAAVAGVSRGQ
jgi:hypothetical protein